MWYHLFIHDQHAATSRSQKFMEAVFDQMVISGNHDVALFYRSDDQAGGVHYYFTPPSRNVAVGCGASPCQKPSLEEAGDLLVGSRSAVVRLFGM